MRGNIKANDFAAVAKIKELQERGAISVYSSLDLTCLVRSFGIDRAILALENLKNLPAESRFKPIAECDKFIGILANIQRSLDSEPAVSSATGFYKAEVAFAGSKIERASEPKMGFSE